MPSPSPEYLAQSQQATIRGVTWMSVSLPIVVVGARVYIRLILRKIFGLDDWFIVLSMILLIIYGGVIEAAVTKGSGRHIEHITINMPDNAVPIALLSQVSQPLVIMSCALGKTSFIMTLFRIGSNTGIRFFLWFILASVNCLHILVSVLLFLRCENPRVLWDPSVQTTCWPVHNYLRIMYFIGAYSAATDFVLALVPWAMMWRLNMKRKEKAGVAIAMSLGIFAGATAIVKCTFLKANSASTDPTYEVGELLLWAGAENALIIVAASLPTLRPLLRTAFPLRAKNIDDSHQLRKNPTRLNIFTPKSKKHHWSAIVETGIHDDQNSNHDSDTNIVRQRNEFSTSDAVERHLCGEIRRTDSATQQCIRKITEVDVVYSS